jgi:hypothetical protein
MGVTEALVFWLITAVFSVNVMQGQKAEIKKLRKEVKTCQSVNP